MILVFLTCSTTFLNAQLHKHTLCDRTNTPGEGIGSVAGSHPCEDTPQQGAAAAGLGMLCHASKSVWRPGRSRRVRLACEQLLSAARDGEQVVLSCRLESDADVIHHESRLPFCSYVFMDVVFPEMHRHVFVRSPSGVSIYLFSEGLMNMHARLLATLFTFIRIHVAIGCNAPGIFTVVAA